MRTWRYIASFVVFVNAQALCALGGGLVDDFAGPVQEVNKVALDSPPIAAPTVVLTNSLFYSRDMEVSYGVQNLSISNGVMAYRVEDVPETGNTSGYFDLIYTADEPIDLLSSGYNGLRIVLSNYTTGRFRPLGFVMTSAGKYDSVGFPRVVYDHGVSSITHIDIPFSAFDRIDLTAVESFKIDAIRLTAPFDLTINRISFIHMPELRVIPGNEIQLSFEGTLQQSTNMIDWVDMDPQPLAPWSMPKTENAQFFRSVGPE